MGQLTESEEIIENLTLRRGKRPGKFQRTGTIKLLSAQSVMKVIENVNSFHYGIVRFKIQIRDRIPDWPTSHV